MRLRAVGIALALAMLLMPAVAAQGQTFKVLYSFTGGADGGYPFAALIEDAKGNLYGTTSAQYCGAVFKVNKSGKVTVLHSFDCGPGGGDPYASLLLHAGSLYGTTCCGGGYYYGVVYSMSDTGEGWEALCNFTGEGAGEYPYAGLVRDAAGNLYGTTAYGGTSGDGTVFKLSKSGNETVLYSFTGRTGKYPFQSLVAGKGFDDLFGATEEGGKYGYGTVFKVATKTGKETVLHSFEYNGSDGAYPAYGYLVHDPQGNLYGTTEIGGPSGAGTVFKLTPDGTETVLYGFSGGADGGYPFAGVVLDKNGNLYGTTYEGGDLHCGNVYGCGTVFMLDTGGKETVLHTFTGGSDGAHPAAALLRDAAGDLYGTASEGGAYDYGTLFKLTP
jgi:uncharacterized repeat protein (TIGR03803 family)